MGGATPISYLARARYVDDIGLAGEDLETFHQFIALLDAEYLDWRSVNEKAA